MTKKNEQPKPLHTCWTCNKTARKYMQEHHVIGESNDPDLTVWACRGCHYLETLLARRKFLSDPKAVGRLITLARLHAGLPDARTIVIYEENTDEN